MPKTVKLPASRNGVKAVVSKGEKKPPIHQDCPWCSYHSTHPPGLAHHIRGVHPKKWRGSLWLSLGHEKEAKPGPRPRSAAERKKRRKLSQLNWYRRKMGYAEISANGAAETSSASNELECPECGTKHKDARGLGVHRRREHGVPGKWRAGSQAKASRRLISRKMERVVKVRSVRFCPSCGTNIEVVTAAINMPALG